MVMDVPINAKLKDITDALMSPVIANSIYMLMVSFLVLVRAAAMVLFLRYCLHITHMKWCLTFMLSTKESK
jgi:hypothetical protein